MACRGSGSVGESGNQGLDRVGHVVGDPHDRNARERVVVHLRHRPGDVLEGVDLPVDRGLEDSAIQLRRRLDPDERLGADANRDVFFERARVGLVEEIDTRSLASSDYQYRGMRERYGMVRARESILPFDLVISGSLTDLSLGAFPRIRNPKTTPDAFLFR